MTAERFVPNAGWPTWLLDVLPQLQPILGRIDCAEQAITATVPERFTFTKQFNAWFLAAQEEAMRSLRVTESFLYARLLDNAEPCRLFDQVFYTRSLAISRQLQAAKWFLSRNDLVNAMTMYRGILEHAANLAACLGEVSKIDPAWSFEDALKGHVALYEALKLRVHGTKIDWAGLLKLAPDEVFSRKGKDIIKYEPTPELMDRTAKSICGDVDRLDKKVSGTRVAYEILCEFLHPNVGVCLAVTESVGPLPPVPEVDTPLVQKTLTSGPPVGFVQEGSSLMLGLFEQFSKVLEFLTISIQQRGESREKCMALVQRINRRLLASNSNFKHPYLMCPCQSGKKIRFCCGSRDEAPPNQNN